MATTPVMVWTKLIGGRYHDGVRSITTDSDGSIYATGYTNGDLDGQRSIGYTGNTTDAFLTKYSSYGEKLWTKVFGWEGGDYGQAITVGADGSIYVVGSTSGGSQSIHGTDAFLAKFSSDGVLVWQKVLGTVAYDATYALTTGLDGSIYISGDTAGDFGGQKNSGNYDVFLANYSADGVENWTQLLGSNGYDYGRSLTTGLDGSIYVTGFTSSASIDGEESNGSADAFLTKYSAGGSKAWTILLGSPSEQNGLALTTGLDGSIYVGGTTSGWLDGQNTQGGTDGFLTKYSADGVKGWTRLLGTAKADIVNSLTTGSDGSIYVGGYSHVDPSGTSAFVTKFGTDGSEGWTKLLLTSGNYVNGYTLTTGVDESIYIGGSTANSLDGQIVNGVMDGFLVKFQETTTTPTYSLSAGSSEVNEGSSATFTLSTTNVPAGAAVPYTLSGVSAADVSGGLSGTAVINSSGVATISVNLINDSLTEGAETLTVTAGGASASTTVNDTSKSVGTYSLSNNSYSVNEGSTAFFTLTTTNLAPSTPIPYTLSGISSSDVPSGLSGIAVVNSSGMAGISVTLLNDNLTEGTETLTVTAGGASASMIVNDTSKSVATYSLSNNSYSVNEGSTAFFTLTTTNLAPSTPIPYTLSGISAADVSGGLSGTAVVNSSGVATISAILLNDKLTEGAETLTVTAGGASASTVVNDTSKSVATYSLSNNSYSVNEGSAASFTLTTKSLASGTSVPYTLSGISAADVSGGLSGTAVVNSSGVATISAILLNDKLTEGAETLTVTAGGASASTVVNDTSKSPTYSLSSASSSVNEGGTAVFTLTSKNVSGYTQIPYTLSGISTADLSFGSLTGSTYAYSSGVQTINVYLRSDRATEGPETLTITVGDTSASVIINDTSDGGPVYELAASGSSVNEGSTAVFTLTTKKVDAGTAVAYTISGVKAADVIGGKLFGTAVVNASGTATISVALANDTLSEGVETMMVTAQGASASLIVNDTSKGIPTYKLSTANSTVNEGGTASFNLSTTNVLPGSSVSWTLEGLSADDVAGGRTSGSAVISVAGSATIDIPVVADQKTEGAEAFTLRVGNTQAVGTVKDTSISSTDKKTIVTDVPSLVNVRGGKVFLSSTNPEEIVGTNKFDTVSSNLASHKARITKTSLGWSIQNNDDTQDTDTLVAVERVDFSNGQSHAFDVGTNGNAGKTAKMLTVLFGPQALNNPQYVGIGIATLDDGQTYQELITTALSVSGLASSDQLVSALYRNLTGYEGTAFQKKLYIDMLDSGAITSERLIELAGDAAMQIQTNLKDLANTGLAYKQSLPLPKPVSYELSSSAPSIDEGGIISISLLTKNLSAGTSVAYTVSGISADDLANASLSGNFVVDGSGLGQITLSVRADQQTEGPETLTLTAGTASIAVSINDVSLVGVSGGEGGGFGYGAGFDGGGGGD